MTATIPLPRLREALLDRLDGSLELPLLPASALGVLTATSREDCGAPELAELLQQDPALAGNVMRIVNSAAYAPVEPIASLPQAVSRLGVHAIRDIAVAVSVRGKMFDATGYTRELREMWAHSALCAVWAQELARLRRRNVEVAFLVGLLHDVGRPVLLDTLTDAALELAGEEPGTPTEDLFAFHEVVPLLDELHAASGARVLETWNLPESVTDPVANHHDPSAAEDREVATLIYFADRIAHAEPLQRAEDALAWATEDPLLDALDLYWDDLVALWEERTTFAERAGALA